MQHFFEKWILSVAVADPVGGCRGLAPLFYRKDWFWFWLRWHSCHLMYKLTPIYVLFQISSLLPFHVPNNLYAYFQYTYTAITRQWYLKLCFIFRFKGFKIVTRERRSPGEDPDIRRCVWENQVRHQCIKYRCKFYHWSLLYICMGLNFQLKLE